MEVVAFKNTGAFNTYNVRGPDNELFDLNGAGVTKIEIAVHGAVLSSENGDITFTGSTVNVRWGAFDLSSGNYVPTWYLYKGATLMQSEAIFGPKKSPVHLSLMPDDRP